MRTPTTHALCGLWTAVNPETCVACAAEKVRLLHVAAPDLLAALKAWYDRKDHSLDCDCCTCTDLNEMAERAMAKAEGKTLDPRCPEVARPLAE